MFKLQGKETEVTETRSQVRQLSEALALFRKGAVLMDEAFKRLIILLLHYYYYYIIIIYYYYKYII